MSKKVEQKIKQTVEPVAQSKQTVDESHEETPEDWLKPKIFSSRNN